MPVTVVTFLGEELMVDSNYQQRQDDGEPWERKPVSKLYYKVTPQHGQRLTVFKNVEHGGWYTLAVCRHSDITALARFILQSKRLIARCRPILAARRC